MSWLETPGPASYHDTGHRQYFWRASVRGAMQTHPSTVPETFGPKKTKAKTTLKHKEKLDIV